MNINQLAKNVILGDTGMWKTPTTESISYTKNGHDLIRENEQSSFWFSHRLSCLVKVIGNNPVKKILDIGGGNGQFSLYLQSMDIETLLLEPGIKGASNAVKNGVVNVINGSLKDAGFVDSGFHSVALLDVLEHIEDDEGFLAEIHRILKNEGKLILTVPAFQFLFSNFDREVGHYRRYTLKELEKKLRENGFKIDYRTYFFSLLPIPILIGRSIINKLKKKERRKGTGHINKSGIFGIVLRVLLWPERLLIKYEIKIPFGSSCLIVARKSEIHGK